MSLQQRILWLLATVTLLSCARPDSTIGSHPEQVTHALAAKPHRLAVVFLPQVSGCNSCDQMISAVISEWQAAPDAEMVVVSVIPDRAQPNDPWLPGAIVRLKPEDYRRYKGKSPLPRVQVWSADGTLLLSRSVPNNGLQAELLTEEMLAARSFTAPIAVASRKAKSP